jgi:hypothetical protein
MSQIHTATIVALSLSHILDAIVVVVVAAAVIVSVVAAYR